MTDARGPAPAGTTLPLAEPRRAGAPRLFTPGPTQIPDAVYAALATPLVPARSPGFMDRMARIARRLPRVFDTCGQVVTVTASGTGAMEAALVNLARRDEPVLIAHAGKFGERWCELAAAHGLPFRVLSRPWGETITPEQLAHALDRWPQTALVLLTHSETATGVVHDVQALAGVVRGHGDALVVVDAVSSAAALPLRMDGWGIDACVAAAHKGFLCPPGLAFVALGPRALERVPGADLPRYYFDLRPALAGVAAGGTPWTPAVSLACALDTSIDLLLEAGLERGWERTARLARATRAAMDAIGLALFADPPGDAVTAVCAPPGIDARQVVAGLRTHGFEIAAGQGRIKRTVFRIAHLGAIDDSDLLALMDALESVLGALDPAAAPALPEPGRARRAAAEVLAGAPAGHDRTA